MHLVAMKNLEPSFRARTRKYGTGVARFMSQNSGEGEVPRALRLTDVGSDGTSEQAVFQAVRDLRTRATSVDVATQRGPRESGKKARSTPAMSLAPEQFSALRSCPTDAAFRTTAPP